MTPAAAATPVLRVLTGRPDYRAYVQYTDRTVFRRRFWIGVLLVPLVLLAATLFEAWRAGSWGALLHNQPLAVLVPGAIVLWAASRWQALDRKARNLAVRDYPGLTDLRLEPDSLVVQSGARPRKYAWKDIVDIVEVKGLMLFVHARAPGLFKATMVPLRPEASLEGSTAAFRTRALELWNQARAPPPATASVKASSLPATA